jgi:membrane protease YdiL (CAAX protease family)
VSLGTSFRRLRLFLVITFAITWGAWWALAALVPSTGLRFDNVPIMSLYILGGFGPTIAALISVFATPAEGSFQEFTGRLFRWRVNAIWYAFALGFPTALEFSSFKIASALGYVPAVPFVLKAWWQIVPLFGTMIVGGGLEELGWRGVAQPALERQTARPLAATIIGAIWVSWHLPLFFIPGTAQFHSSFLIFAVFTFGNTFLLAWLYARTQSIVLCIGFHAASNASSGMHLPVPAGNPPYAAVAALINLAVGACLLLVRRPQQTNISAKAPL